jgi:glycosyltransferase involved in cell wall biosynthesis
MPKLSIITINFNNAPGLRRTIESVVSQNSHDFEYIIVDGGSSDGSVEVIKEYAGKISYWVSEPDSGIYNAMNKGIRAARGEYCQFLNSGDLLVAYDVIEKMLAALPDCGVFYGNMLKKLPEGKIFRDVCEQGRITMLTLYRGALNHSPAFIKRSLFEKYGLYDENLRIVSDWKWYLVAIGLNNESVRYINTDVTYFDMNGISNSNSTLEKEERRRVLIDLIPPNILEDYDTHWRNIDQVNRINKYKLPRFLFWFVDRIIFQWEKTRQNLI